MVQAKEKNIKTRDIYMAYFSGDEHIQQGWRPAVITQNNLGNIHSPNVIVVPLTSSTTKSRMPTHVSIPCNDVDGLTKDSVALCEAQRDMSKSCLGEYLGVMPERYMALIGAACTEATPTLLYMTDEEIINKVRNLRKKYSIALPISA